MKKYRSSKDEETMKRLSPSMHVLFLKKLPCLFCGKRSLAAKSGVPSCDHHLITVTPEISTLAHHLRLLSGNFEAAMMAVIAWQEKNRLSACLISGGNTQ